MAEAKITDLPQLDAAPDDADVLEIVDDPGGASDSKQITVANLRAGMAPPLLHVRDEKASGTNGGGSASDAYQTRVLNTVEVNQITGASLASNQITLPAGTYRIRASAPAVDVRNHRVRWRNVDDTETTLLGVGAFSRKEETGTGSTVADTRSHVQGEFTIAAEKTFELQHYTLGAIANIGLGAACNSDAGEVEIYSEVWIEKVA